MAEKKVSKIATKKFHPSKYIEVNPTLDASKKGKAMLTMGDFSPPSIADQRLVESLKKYAKLIEADSLVFVQARNVSEGYLNEQQRIQMSQSVFGNIVHPYTVSNLGEALGICESEYSSVTIVCAQESMDEVTSFVDSIRDRLKYESIEVIPHGDPVRGDVIAEHVVNGDFTSFKQSLATTLRADAQQIFEQMTTQIYGLNEGYLEEKIRPMSYLERIKKAQTMRRYAKRIQIAKERAANRRASPEKLRERARKRALEIIRARILRNKEYSELSAVEKNALDARLMNIPPAVIDRIAKRMIPVVRKAETERLSRSHGHHVSLSASSTGTRGHVNESFDSYADALIDRIQTINELNALIEAVESSNVDRVRRSISNEKKADALKHHRMMVTAKHADINKQASARFADLRNNIGEANEVIQGIIQKEMQRKNMLAALKDYETNPDITVMSGAGKGAVAQKMAKQHGLDPDDVADLMKMYNRYVVSKGHKAYLNTFDVSEEVEDPENSTPDQREWGTDDLTDVYKKQTPGQYFEEKYKPKGLWYNIRKRREKGLRRLRPGEKGYPKTLDIEDKS